MKRLFLALALSVPAVSAASSESDMQATIRALEARLAALEAQATHGPPAPQPTPRVSPAYVNVARALYGWRTNLYGAPILGTRIGGGGSSTFTGFTGTISSAQMIDPYVPVDGTMNVTGAVTASSTITAGGSGVILTAGTFRNNIGTLFIDPINSQWRIGTTGAIEDGNANDLITFTDDGTTGYLTSTSTKQTGTITLSGGTGTATVRSGAVCVCTDTTANASVQCAVATTTLTATGTASDVIAYWCN